MTVVWVVALALERPDGRILVQQRPPDKAHGGLWEFPGGKVEPGETPRAALVREIAEELGVELDADALAPAGFADGNGIAILLYAAHGWRGEPQAREGGAWGWFTRAEIADLAMPPLDYRLLAGLG